ncbi:MAG: alanyl-tRNA editing protein [Methanomassiliicoccaceae archaeon]|nr:alanyl-tRNA editing protein [Methanomassiliicoccaceae archaeon]
MIRIYERDAYVFEFEADVTSTDGDWISLNATAFYPGGGGQVNDLGKICGLDVKDVRADGDNVLHHVPGHRMKVGDTIWCSVDWEKRYDMMIGHTAEHLLFGALKRIIPDINIVKIFISPESKYVIVDRDVQWDDIGKAQEFVNAAINDNLSVTKSTMGRDDPEMENIRAKMERIDDDLITVVEIGDVDAAACGGLHVRETGEIGALLIDRKVSAGKDGYAIHFRVGKDASVRSMELANKCMQIVEILGTKTEDVVRAAQNLKHNGIVKTEQLRSAISEIISSLRPDIVKNVSVYSGIFETDDRTAITDAAERIKGEGSVSVFLAKGESLSVIVSSGVKCVDCSLILGNAMKKVGGRGGGKADFAQGGVPDVSVSARVLENIIQTVKDALDREN